MEKLSQLQVGEKTYEISDTNAEKHKNDKSQHLTSFKMGGIEYKSGDQVSLPELKVPVDAALSDTSENAVQNKVIKSALDGKQPLITEDNKLSSSLVDLSKCIKNNESGLITTAGTRINSYTTIAYPLSFKNTSNSSSSSAMNSIRLGFITANSSGFKTSYLEVFPNNLYFVNSLGSQNMIYHAGNISTSLSTTTTTPPQTKIVATALNNKLDKANPVGTGSLSINRKADTTIGTQSIALGYETEASGDYSVAIGPNAKASASSAIAIGSSNKATGSQALATGYNTTASGSNATTFGNTTEASGGYSVAEGSNTKAIGWESHAAGYGTIAAGDDQLVIGKFNIADTENKYAFIIGNGTSDTNRSNAFAVKWDGTIVTSNF